MVLLTMSLFSRAQQANPQGPGTGANAGTSLRNGTGNSIDTIGDPSIFGLNEWKVYAWNSTNSDSWVLNYAGSVSYTHLRAHETVLDIVCRLLLEKTKLQSYISIYNVH